MSLADRAGTLPPVSDTDRQAIEERIQTTRQLMRRDPRAALVTAAETLELARSHLAAAQGEPGEMDAARLVAVGLQTQARALQSAGRSEDALGPARQAAELAESIGLSHEHARALQTLGLSLSDLGDHGAALGHLERALLVAREEPDDDQLAAVHLGLGIVESRLGDEAAAAEHYEAMLSLTTHPHGRRAARGNLGISLRVLGRLEEALAHHEAVNAEAIEAGEVVIAANSGIELGIVLHRLGRFTEARDVLLKSLEQLGPRGPAPLLVAARLRYAELLLDAEGPFYDPPAALRELELGRDAVGRGAYELERIELEQAFAAAWEALGDHAAALAHHRRFHQLDVAWRQKQLDRRATDARAGLRLETARSDADAAIAAQIALLQAKDALANAAREQQALMDMMRHDLKSPLTGLLYVADALANPGLDPEFATPEKLRHLAERMLAILDQVERFGTAGQGGLVAEPVPLGEAIHSVIDQYRSVARTKHIAIECAVPAELTVLADPAALAQCMANYVSNALKFSAAGSSVQITSEPQDHGIAVVVADRGPGLSPQDIADAFRPFQRLSAKPTGDEASTGLGLSIVDRLARSMAGSTFCEPRPGGGARFGLVLPVAD